MDVPGFGDTRQDDMGILKNITTELVDQFESHLLVRGIIWLHNINENRWDSLLKDVGDHKSSHIGVITSTNFYLAFREIPINLWARCFCERHSSHNTMGTWVRQSKTTSLCEGTQRRLLGTDDNAWFPG